MSDRSRRRRGSGRPPRTRTDLIAVVLGVMSLLAAVVSAISILMSAQVGAEAATIAVGYGWDLRHLLTLLGTPVVAVLGGRAIWRTTGTRRADRIDVGLAVIALVIALRMAMWADGYGWFGAGG